MRVFHGSKEIITRIAGHYESASDLFGGVFASSSSAAALSHGDKLHIIDIEDDKILSKNLLFHLKCNESEKLSAARLALKNEIAECDDESLDEIFYAVINEHSIDEHLWSFLCCTQESAYVEWEQQRLLGVVANALDYKAVEMSDEHGTSYLVLPGNKIEYSNERE